MGTRDTAEPRDSPSAHRDGTRGQTTLDFAIGISIFLTVLLFILLFLPGILSPFTESAQEETITSNRVADKLTSGLLASPAEPNVLNAHCTVGFFAAPDESTDTSVPGQCNYETGTLEEQVGVAEGFERVRVVIQGNISTYGSGTDTLCWDNTGTDTGLVEETEAGADSTDDLQCDVTLTRGEPPTTQDSITAFRTVSLEDTDVSLLVEVW